ncbi:MAG: PIN domain nuclease [Actinomycetota bacterium]
MILVDTSVWIDFVRGTNTVAAAALHTLVADGTPICIADINVNEFMRGVVDDNDYYGFLEDILRFPVLSPQGLETHLAAAQIYRDCRRQGKTIRNSGDCLIAAIAIENDKTVLHNDADFDQIASVVKDLRIVKPEGLIAG